MPLLLSVAFQQLYQMADSMIVGRFAESAQAGELALAAVGASYPITQLFVAVATGINIGTSVLVSQLFGAKRYLRMKTAISTALITTTVVSLLLTLFGAVCTNGLMSALNTSADIFADASLYLRVYVFGLLFLFIYNVCTGIFNAMGDSRTPLFLLILSSVGNVILDVVFVAMLHWGVAGVAWATFIAQGASGVFAFFLLMRRVRTFDTGHHFILFAPEMLRRLTNYAIPSIAQQSFVSVGNLIIQYYVNLCGPTVIAGFSVANRINMFALTCCMSFASGLSSYVAQNIGAGNVKRAKKSMFTGIAVGVLAALLLKSTVFKGEAVPFVMELPNYRLPGLKNVAQLLWEKARDFLQKAFTVIFAATIVIWFLQNFDLQLRLTADPQASILARIAGDIAPLFGPLGFADWRISTALITGFMAKESVVSSLLILFGSEAALSAALTPAQAAPLLVFCLLYTPCIAAVASVKRELGNKWAVIMVVNQCAVAWLCALLVRLAAVVLF